MVRKTQNLIREGKKQTHFDKNAYKSATHLNKEGAPSFSQPIELQTLQNLMCNIVEPSFYTDTARLLDQSFKVYKKMSEKNPELFAKMLIYARNQGYMRLQPALGLVYLSVADIDLFKNIFDRVIRTPKDLLSFIDLCNFGPPVPRKGMGRGIKQTINKWITENINEYWTIKYTKELRIASKMAHTPKIKDKNKQNMLDYIHDFKKNNGVGEIIDGNNQIKAYEALKRAISSKEIISLIKTGKLPHKKVTSIIVPETDGWEALMYQMPYFALLRHLDTLNRNSVFDNPENIDYVCRKLTNKEAIKKSKIFPFRIFTAYKFASNLPDMIKLALEGALEMSLSNIPKLDGKVIIGTDVSGSMTYHPSRKNLAKYRYIDIAGVFTAALLKVCDNPKVIPFDTNIYNFIPSEFQRSMDIVNWFSNISGGGTNLSLPLKNMINHNYKADIFIGITDNEDWVGEGIEYALQKYRNTINSKLEAFLIRIDPYIKDVAIQTKPKNKNHFISGWSDKIPSLISMILQGESQLDTVKNIKL
ncbi:MAG: TROVE domain-containing protein [Candidatus Lokiarchaeota archaeon]|nr:TROVE domain-containing protein [Candidatus Lokiarchaeota archaeon]